MTFQAQLFFLPKILAHLLKLFQFLILRLFLWWKLCSKYTKWVIVSCNIGQLEHSALALLTQIHFTFSFHSEFGLHDSSTPEVACFCKQAKKKGIKSANAAFFSKLSINHTEF